MPKLFIPELGTVLTLAADWTFPLYEEDRNESLWNIFDADNDPVVKLYHKVELAASDATVAARAGRDKYFEDSKRVNFFDSNKRVLTWDDYLSSDAYKEEIRANRVFSEVTAVPPSINITIVKGTELKLDRIYVRKGASEYSSLTFSIVSSPDSKLTVAKGKKPRFFAKLQDCNEMEIL